MPRPSAPSTIRARLLPLTLSVLGGVLPACSKPEDPEVRRARPAVPVPLQFSRLDRGSQPARMIGKLRVPERLEPWISEAPITRTEPLPGADPAGAPLGVLLAGSPSKVLLVPGTYQPGAFNRVVVELASRVEVRGRLEFLSSGRVSGSHRAVLEAGDGGVRTLRFEAGGLPLLGGACQQLRLELESARPCFVTGISFWKATIDEYLPDPSTGPVPVTIGGDTRPALGISNTAGLQLDLRIPENGALRAAYGLIPRFRSGRDRPELRVRVESGAGTRTFHTFKFGRGGSLKSWSPMTIPLDEHAGRRARVRFEVGSVEGRPQYVALSEPKVLLPRHLPSTLLLITSDSHRADFFGGDGPGRKLYIPNLARLAERGVLFSDCLATTNLPRPSHVALMTGRSPRDTGILDDREPLPEEIETLAQVLRRNGWSTVAAVGTATLAPPGSGLGRGFDRMLAPEEGFHPAKTTIAWLRLQLRQLDDQPVFVWLHLSEPQLPYAPLSQYSKRYLGQGFDLEDPRLPAPIAPISPPSAGFREKTRFYLTGLYQAEISSLDGALAALVRRERFRRGWVVYTSDHGESLGEHGYWWTHAGLYPQTLRVPLVIAGPGARPGTRIAAPVSQLDLARTLLDLVGLAHESFPGRSLLDHQRPEGRPEEPRFALGAYGEHASITASPWHLQLTLSPRDEANREQAGTPHAMELYDLVEDPLCENDRVNIERERAIELRAALLEWLGEGWIDPECRCDWCTDFR